MNGRKKSNVPTQCLRYWWALRADGGNYRAWDIITDLVDVAIKRRPTRGRPSERRRPKMSHEIIGVV